MALRLNEFQLAVCREPSVPSAPTESVAAIEVTIGIILEELALLAHRVGTDLDYCALTHLERRKKAA